MQAGRIRKLASSLLLFACNKVRFYRVAAQLHVVMVGVYHFQWITSCPGLEVIKLELILRLKITRVSKQPIIALYFVSETVLRFYNL